MKRFLSHRKGVFALLLALFMGMGTAYAYSFSATCSTGQTLYYNIIDATNHYVEITYPGTSTSDPWGNFTKPTGNITLPSSVIYNSVTYTVTKIGSYAFKNCSGLTGSLVIPNTVTSIGNDAFEECTGFTGLLSLGNSLTMIGQKAFYDCWRFTGQLTLPNSLSTIAMYAFYNCYGFTGSLVIPNSIYVLNTYAFCHCRGFSELTIGSSLSSINYGVFYGCTGLTAITVLRDTPPSLGSDVFYNVPTTIPVTVPCGKVSAYQGASGWNAFTNIQEYCDPLIYSINSDGMSVTVTGHVDGTSATGQLIIPSTKTIDGVTYTVTAIGSNAFYNCSGLTGSLTIPDSVIEIGSLAFYGCSGFTGSLTLGNSVTVIGDQAFTNCSGFTGSLTIPNSVTTMGIYAFYYCSGFTGSLTLSSSLTSISNRAFFSCNFTGTLTIPNSVTTIDEWAFGHCSGLTGSLTIPNSVTSIGKSAFYNCRGFTGSLNIPNLVTSIGESAFYNCSGLTGSLTIGTSVASIGKSAFKDCTGFTQVKYNAINCADVAYDAKPFEGITATTLVIGSSVQRIPTYLFKGCSSFTGSLTIPNSVTEIGGYAFEDCSGFNGTLTLGSSLATIGQYAFASCDHFTGNLVIPNSVTTLGRDAFAWCDGFNGTLTLSNNLTTIGDFAFYYLSCNGPLTIPNSVTSIGEMAFNYCYNFTSLSLGNNVATIGQYAFANGRSLTGTLTIPASVTSIGQGAFKNDNGFTQVNYNATNCADIASDAKPFEACSGSLTIGNNVQSIPAYMFNGAGFTGILTIGEGVTSVGAGAFKDCTGFTQVNYNATSCGDADYMSYPFENCTGTLSIGSNVTRIPANIFAYADFTGSINIPNAVTTIGYSAFYCCYDLDGYLSLGNSLTTIGIYAFYSCTGLTGSIIIPNTVNKLDMYAFAHCSGITHVTIGSAVTTMNYGAFYWCNGLISITALPETPPALGDDVFYEVPRNIPVYVPCSALEGYQAAEPWNEFNLQCNPVVTVTAVPTEGGSVSGGGTFEYGAQCTVTATPNSNYLFMHWSKNGDVVSSNATYSFYVYNDTDLEAVFMPESYTGDIIGEGEETNSYLPSYSYYNYTLSQQIYTADELGGIGTITNISFFNAGSEKTRTYDIYMKRTTKSAFNSDTDWISASASDKVYSGTVVMRAGQWTTIVLDTPFAYNGTNNLVLIVDDNTGSWEGGMACRVYDADGTQALRIYSDYTDYDPATPSSYTGTRLSVKNQIMLNRPNVYNIAATSDNTAMGTVTGGGTYGRGDICMLKATANSGYTFLNWTDEYDVTVSTDANYSFTVTGSRSLTANFLSGTDMCSLTFDLYDIYSDGWNGNYLMVDYGAGMSVKLTVSYDNSNETYTLPFNNGSHVDLSWIEGGWPEECYFTVSYEDGDVMYMAMDLDENFEYGFDMDCAGQPEGVTYLGDHSTANNYFLPSYSYYNYALSEQIYTAEEIGMEGFINGIAFYNNGAQETRYYEIYLTTTDKAAFESQTDWIDASDAVLVYSGAVFMQSDKWTPIKFNQNSFDYDGVSNLVLIVDDNTEDYTNSPHMSCLVYETESLQCLRVYSDGINYDPMSPPTSYVSYEFPAVMNVKNQVVFGMVPCYEPTDLYVTDITATTAEVSWSSSYHGVFDVQYGLVNPNTDFEDGFGYWTTIDADGDGYGWVPASATSGVYYSFNLPDDEGHNNSDNFAISGSYTNYTYIALTPDNYLVSPRVTLGGSITFWACAQDAGYAAEHFGVAVSTTSNTNASAFTTIQEWTLTAKSTGAKVNPETTRSGNRTQGAWYQYTVDLSAYAGQTGYVAIRHFGCTDEFLLDVDDITIVQPGITPAMTTINNVANTYVLLNALTPGLQYEVKVRSHCGGEYYSDWVSTSFTTPYCCAILVDADNPFFESFEGPDFAPGCWENIPSSNYSYWISSDDYAHTGSHSAASYYYGDIYLVLPDIELSASAPAAQLSFWSYNTYPEDFEVGNNTVVLLNGGTETELWSAEEVSESWVKTTIDLSAYLGQTISLAFKYAGNDGNGWYFDDVEVSVPTNVTQTIQLASGINWVSFYVETDLDAVKAALVDAMPVNGVTIAAQDGGQTFYNGSRWRGALASLDMAQMYRITVPEACEIVLEGTPVNPADHPITIKNGLNWIAYPLMEEMTLQDAFASFAVRLDEVRAKDEGVAVYNGTRWRGALTTLVPGKGYIYKSAVNGNRTFVFPTSGK